VAKPLRLRLNAGMDARVPTANTTTSNEQLTNPIFKDPAEILSGQMASLDQKELIANSS